MEESVTENESHQSFRSPPKRRRSTFFERRESLVPQSSPVITTKNNTENDDKHNQQLLSYYEKLLIEKDQWKKEVKSSRSNYHELRQQYQMAVETSSKLTMPFSSLSKEDIELVQGKYNTLKIIESQKKLHESFKVVKALYERYCELENAVLSHCENKVDRIRDFIFEHSVLESED